VIVNGREQQPEQPREDLLQPGEELLARAMPSEEQPDGVVNESERQIDARRPASPGEGPPDEPEEREADEERPTPKIYVASLSDYNAGRLHGRWIDANQPTHGIWSDIGDMLAESPEPGAEEWAIHDYEGFWPLELSE
jgi:hypothetical protein